MPKVLGQISATILVEMADRVDVVNVPPIPPDVGSITEMRGRFVDEERRREILALILAPKLALIGLDV